MKNAEGRTSGVATINRLGTDTLIVNILVTARSKLRKVPFLAPSVCGVLFVCEISPLNGFAPSSHGRRVWFLARTSLKVKVR